MTTWIDFAELRREISLEAVLLKFYALTNLTRQGQKLVGPCPIHRGVSTRAFNADLKKNVWHCFSQCKAGGNQLDLVAKREQVSIREAALRLHTFFRSKPDSPKPVPEPQPPAAPEGEDREPNPAIDVTLELKAEHSHLTEVRGLSTPTIERFGLGYCAKGVLRGCIAIPIHNVDGELVAYAGRRLKPETIAKRGKYVFPKGFRKDQELFNYHRAVAADSCLIVVEGFFGAIALTEHGLPNVVATMGSSPSATQLELLSAAPEIVVLYDGDEAGQRGTELLTSGLANKTILRTAQLPDGCGPDDLGARAVRWLVRGLRELDLTSVTLTKAIPPHALP